MDSLSLGYTTASSSTFNPLLTGQTWDLIVVDCPNAVPGSPQWTPLINYVNGGGRAIMSFWDLDNDSGYGDPALPGAFGVSVTSSFSTPQNVYRWQPGHAVFNTPNLVGDLTSWTDDYWIDNGDTLALAAGPGAVGVAGFTTTSQAGQAAIVIGNSGRTIYNGFLFDDASQCVPLIANEIMYVVPEPVSLSLLAVGGLLLARRRSRS